MFHKMKNTDWICINAYSETMMSGKNLDKVTTHTFRLVFVIVTLLILAVIFGFLMVVSMMKKKGEKKALETERLFEEMSLHIPLAFAIVKKNEKVAKFVSYNFYDILEEKTFEFSFDGLKKWTNGQYDEKARKILEKDDHFEMIIQKNEKYFSVGMYSIGIINNAKHYTIVINNITEDMNAKNLLEDSMHRADEASKSKTQFLSKMSHEIRTPLNSVIGFSGLALDGWNSISQEEVHDYLEKIQISGKYLLELVSDILDISRIEENRMQIDKRPCSLDSMVDEITDAFSGQVERKKQQFVVDKNYNEDVVLNMDSYHTKQILNNLISNSCKYTEEGGVIGFEITTKQISEEEMSVQFIVQDTGIGMSEEFQKKIFEPFTQEDRGMLMKKQLRGSGLGMSICKNLVELQDGTIKVESELGEGSSFTVAFIYEIAKQAEVAAKHEKQQLDCTPLKGKKILVVDDVDMNRFFIERVLEKMGIDYAEAADGKQAVEMFEKSDINEYFAIFMDVNMPVMNGHVATETIRKLDRKDAKSVMIAGMTADAFSDDVNKALMCGMNYHVSKPIQIDRVAEILMETYEKGRREK